MILKIIKNEKFTLDLSYDDSDMYIHDNYFNLSITDQDLKLSFLLDNDLNKHDLKLLGNFVCIPKVQTSFTLKHIQDPEYKKALHGYGADICYIYLMDSIKYYEATIKLAQHNKEITKENILNIIRMEDACS